MLRVLASFIACLMLAGFGAGAASAKQCRDANGKFMKCPPAATAKATKCRDAKGKFTKCPAMTK